MEAYVKGRWGAVCGQGYRNSWDASSAAVVCRQLGLPWSGAIPFVGSRYPEYVESPGPGTNGSMPFVMSWATCNGTEAMLQDCGFFYGIATYYYNAGGCEGQDAGKRRASVYWEA